MMDETKQILTAILGRLDEMGADIQAIKSDVAVLKSDVAVLKTDVAVLKTDVAVMKADMAEMKDTQHRHERILELLSVKSVDQEASIRELRKTQS